MKLLSTITATLILGALEVAALEQTLRGCFEAGEKGVNITRVLEAKGNSSGICMKACVDLVKPVAAMGSAVECFCGSILPTKKVDDKFCDITCPGINTEKCGSVDGTYITVWLTGVGKVEKKKEVTTISTPTSTSKSTSSSSSSPSESASKTAEPTEEPKKKSSGVSKAGAAAGAVVGVLAFAAIVGGGILLYKRRRQQQVEEEYRRTLAVQSFGKKPEADHRLEPVMLQRRASDGSIADNEDYSRRILKVTNPDG